MRILVTGASGNVGRSLVAQLSGFDVVAMGRTPGFVSGDLSDPSTLDFEVDAAFLMWPLRSGVLLPAVLDAVAARARRVVFLASGAVQDLPVPAQVDLVARSGLEWTFIRPSTFAVNTLWWARQIRCGDVVRGAYGSLGMALLHEADIAAVAARALTEDGHCGRVYHLTGPEVVSQAEQVRLIGDVLGRPLRWEELPRPAGRDQLLLDGLPESFVDVLLDTYASMGVPEVTHVVEEVTGVPARTFQQWVADHRADFSPSE